METTTTRSNTCKRRDWKDLSTFVLVKPFPDVDMQGALFDGVNGFVIDGTDVFH
jgi:hypothetical protein